MHYSTFWIFSLILFFSPLLFGADLWQVLLPVQVLIFLAFIIDYKNFCSRVSDHNIPKYLFIPWILLTLILFLSCIFSVNFNVSVSFITYYLAVSACFLLASQGRISDGQIYYLCLIMIAAADLQAVITFLQKMNFLPHDHWNPTDFPAGTFFTHNHLAGLLEITLPVVISFIFFNPWKNKKFFNVLLVISLLLQMSGLILSESRAGWIGFASGFVFFLIFGLKKIKFGRFIVLVLVLIATVTVFFSYNERVYERFSTFLDLNKDVSFQIRPRYWKTTLDIIREHPLLGTGPGTFPVVFPQYRPADTDMRGYVNQPHNDYLGWMAETGFLSFPCILAVFLFFVIRVLRAKTHTNPLVIAAGTAVLSTGVHSLVDYNLRIPALAFYLAILAGLSFSGVNPVRVKAAG
ncbi:MAG: O-antigen ligase family protein [Candidatus Aureabacteria bacterium]|nr:O-antigen ligase family protein [Candidatus Auribacterota bacterium]